MSKIKKFNEQEQSLPEQLSLFNLLTPARNDYSHTFNIYDEIPRAQYGKPTLIGNQFLHVIKRNFEVGGKQYSTEITPARIINKKGEERDFYIGKREEIVEEALRKLAAEGSRAETVYLDGNFAIIFTRKALFDELAAHGHNYSYDQIEQALEILLKTSIKLSEEGSEETHFFHPIEGYGIKGKNGEDVTYVKFSPFVTKSIQSNSYRLINYKKLLGYASVIAYRLHKKLTHHFVYAAEEESHNFSLNKTYQNFGLSTKLPLTNRVREMEKALSELTDAKIITGYESHKVFARGQKGKVDDYVFTVYPHKEFIDDAKKANADVKRRIADARLLEVMPDFYRDKFGKK